MSGGVTINDGLIHAGLHSLRRGGKFVLVGHDPHHDFRAKSFEEIIMEEVGQAMVAQGALAQEVRLVLQIQVVAEAVEQIAVPVIPPKIQPPMKVEKRSTPVDESAPAVATSPSVSDGYVLPDPQELLSDPSGPIARLSDDELAAADLEVE